MGVLGLQELSWFGVQLMAAILLHTSKQTGNTDCFCNTALTLPHSLNPLTQKSAAVIIIYLPANDQLEKKNAVLQRCGG